MIYCYYQPKHCKTIYKPEKLQIFLNSELNDINKSICFLLILDQSHVHVKDHVHDLLQHRDHVVSISND